MIRSTFAVAALLLTPLPALAQVQADLDARYDRALAAGYKALFLCSAIANAERNGAARTPESVMEWELTGIQEPLDEIVPELAYRVVRQGEADDPAETARITSADGYVRAASIVQRVEVEWTDTMPARTAVHDAGDGCHLLPVGASPPNQSGSTLAIRVGEPAALQGGASDAQVGGVTERAFTPEYGVDSRTTAVIVMEDGVLRQEQYAEGFGPDVPQRTWSVAKSIAATIVGAAVQRGEADVMTSAGLGEDENDPRRAITIDDGLRMATGRYTDTPGNRTDPLYFGGATVDERSVDWPLLREPGSIFRYANNDTLIAIKAIEDTFEAHPPSELFATLGMAHTVAETDWQGNYILSSQVWSTARDLARLGQLYLDDGVLPDGTRVLPEGWVEYVSAPDGPQPDGDWGYGAGWWIMSGFEGIPDDAFAARGNRGQYIVVIPSEDVVIVRRGEDPAGGSGFDIAALTQDVLSALDE